MINNIFDLPKASEEKERIQRIAEELIYEYDNILLSWATGCSKTRASMRMVYKYEETLSYPTLNNFKIFIVLKETNHRRNWEEELKKWGMEYMLKYITFFCYASLHKYIEEHCNVLILDECHALSEMRENYLKTIKCDKIISLSATVDKFVKKRIKAYKSDFYEYHISLQDAIDKGILPQPTIKVVYIDLDEEKEEWESPWTKKGKEKGFVPTLSAKEYYKALQAKIDNYERKYLQEGEAWAHNKRIQAMGVRKKFMAKAKTKDAKKLLKLLNNKRYICFTGSIEQCNELGANGAIHSKIDSFTREYLINDFNEGRTNHLYAVGMLRESMNLNDIEAGIIVQLDNQSGSFFQMAGRSMRAIAPEVYILVLRGTKDEDYFAKATKGLSSQYFSDFVWPEE